MLPNYLVPSSLHAPPPRCPCVSVSRNGGDERCSSILWSAWLLGTVLYCSALLRSAPLCSALLIKLFPKVCRAPSPTRQDTSGPAPPLPPPSPRHPSPGHPPPRHPASGIRPSGGRPPPAPARAPAN